MRFGLGDNCDDSDDEPLIFAEGRKDPGPSKASMNTHTRLSLKLTDVLYVTNKDAKTLKTALESDSLLDKTFRMTKADAKLWNPKMHIAVPVVPRCLKVMQGGDLSPPPAWLSLVIGTGKQEVPFSSVVLSQHKKQMGVC